MKSQESSVLWLGAKKVVDYPTRAQVHDSKAAPLRLWFLCKDFVVRYFSTMWFWVMSLDRLFFHRERAAQFKPVV